MASTRTKRNRRDEGGSTPKEGHSKKKGAEKKHFRVPKAGLEALGGEWASLDPFEGNENELYEWISDPALWARVVLGDIDRPSSRPPSRASMGGNGDGGNGNGDDTSAAHGRSNGHADRRSSSSRSQQRLGQLHAGFREALDADGFVLWRSFPPLGPSHLTLRQAGLPLSRLELCRFSIAAQKLTPSSRFGSGWEVRSFPAAAVDSPPWADAARQVIARATFPFMGSTLQLVDQDWMNSRFQREDALLHALCEGDGPSSRVVAAPHRRRRRRRRTPLAPRLRTPAPRQDWMNSRFQREDALLHALCEGDGPSSRVVAAALSTPFPAERLLRSMLLSEHSDEVLYIDAIVATQRGAAYRLLHDLVLERRAAHPDRRLVVVLMAVCSSEVLACYARWRFCYGGILAGGPDDSRRVANRLHRLQIELARFEAAVQDGWSSVPRMLTPAAPRRAESSSVPALPVDELAPRARLYDLQAASPRLGVAASCRTRLAAAPP
eukprot:CAMPEP_0185532052 /NCGR_PEP_ID=MMETSP1366-20130426/107753_1 /TAXON_ID=38817 /ORGANISM="Gephyrocapsa oceanica, Strain RCC1303" /LENGTH=493 /DNA_ID=CAMNT_0028143773 /DNA_START=156 /DNA_END=1635 /DNA_ORIENTATION=+